MTLSSPPEHPLRAPLDRLGDPPSEGVWELSLGIYLIVKGFRPSQVLHDDGRHTGVDGPLLPPLLAPEPATAQ